MLGGLGGDALEWGLCMAVNRGSLASLLCARACVRGRDKQNIVLFLLSVLGVHSGLRTSKSNFSWMKIFQSLFITSNAVFRVFSR